MSKVLFQIGPITIYWYSFLILVAVIVGYQIVVSYSKKISYKTNEIMDMVLYLVIFSIIGARAYYVIFNFSLFIKSFLIYLCHSHFSILKLIKCIFKSITYLNFN